MKNQDFPLVSLCILVYNHKPFIKETIEGALSQDYPNLEIIISDDNSPDNSFEYIEELLGHYQGRHRLVVRRNNTNLGLVKHVNKLVFEESHGDMVILSGGDDVCLPEMVSCAVRNILASGCDSMSLNANIINNKSEIKGILCDIRNKQNSVYSLEDYLSGNFLTTGACRIIKREIFDFFGPLNDNCQTEDTTHLLRTFLYGKVGYCYTPVINYRVHENNLSGFHSMMTRFDPTLMYEQYKRDVDLAYEKRRISAEMYQRLQDHISYYLYHNVAVRRLYKEPSCMNRVFYALSLLFSKHYSRAQVKGFLRTIREWHKVGI